MLLRRVPGRGGGTERGTLLDGGALAGGGAFVEWVSDEPLPSGGASVPDVFNGGGMLVAFAFGGVLVTPRSGGTDALVLVLVLVLSTGVRGASGARLPPADAGAVDAGGTAESRVAEGRLDPDPPGGGAGSDAVFARDGGGIGWSLTSFGGA